MGWATLRGLGLCQFLAIECCRFRKIDILFFMRFYVALKRLVSLLGRLVACSARIVVDRQTHRPTTVTLAAHAHRGLNISMAVKMYLEKYAPKQLNICKWLFIAIYFYFRPKLPKENVGSSIAHILSVLLEQYRSIALEKA